MKLWHSIASPVVRKVMTVAHHHQLEGQIEICPANAFSDASGHNLVNPVGKIPALALEDGTNLYDSRVIAEYFDSIGNNTKVFLSGDERWQDLTQQSFADGILDNAIPLVSEAFLRPGESSWPERHAQFRARIESSLALLEKTLDKTTHNLSIGTIALTCVLDWARHRQEMIGITAATIAPNLYEWVDAMNAKHACLQASKLTK